MKSFRIISPPLGNAPKWVRRQWVGLEFPINKQPAKGVQMGVLGGKPENLNGYQVRFQDAMIALGRKSQAAANWWRLHSPPGFRGDLVFDKKVCKAVE